MTKLSDRHFHAYGNHPLRTLSILISVFAITPLRAEPADSALASQDKKTASISFDLDMLKGRGIDPKLAAYFAEAPRFREGSHVVTLFVNGERKGQVNALFDSQGELIFDKSLLDKAQLTPLPPLFAVQKTHRTWRATISSRLSPTQSCNYSLAKKRFISLFLPRH